ncbi:MAG: endonuclease domain-containing protein [Rubrivivax sp.]|nr:endonuclease domain-containing protein [Rubrivivax sp.]
MRARELRASSTDAERLLWRHLRNRHLAGHKFRRQHPIAGFIADFACLEAHLVIELDGGQHFEPDAVAADGRRTKALARAGFHVMRFDNRQMLAETGAVLASIEDWLAKHHPHPSPLPRAGEGVSHPHPGPLPHAGEGVEDKELA